MKTRLYPMVQFKKDTWEIDEFEWLIFRGESNHISLIR